MPVPIVLNEISHKTWPDDYHHGLDCIASVGDSLRGLAKLKRSIFLLSDEKLGAILLGERTLHDYLADGSVRDHVRLILTFANRSPLDSFQSLDADGSECIVGESASRGVLYAHLLGAAALSFPSNELCKRDLIEAKVLELSQKTADLCEKNVTVPNIASPGHVLAHQDRLYGFRQEDQVETGLDLWNVLGDWCPNLVFLPRVEEDLRRYLKASLGLGQIVSRLVELESAVREWGGNGEPNWKSKVTPESDSRRSLCNFTSLEGNSENYELHARYTPGAGRIHFRLLPERRKIEIAYIGEKL